MKTIAIDAMGGDFGPRVTVGASVDVLRKKADLTLILVGIESKIEPVLKKLKADDVRDRIIIQPASEMVGMDEDVASALRNKKDSSMRVAINMVKEGRAQACVSAGNTGALMATAKFVLKTLSGIDRPAIMTRFPTRTKKEVRVLDLGANVDSSPEQLYQFAVMGSLVTSAVESIEAPIVRLLNVGEEDIKGNEQVKKTAELLINSDCLNYQGFVEGNSIFHGGTDVVVCDGFVGNVMLKGCEGLMRLLFRIVKEEMKRSILAKFGMLFLLPMMKRVRRRIDPQYHNGATFLGLNGIVIKSHGSAKRASYVTAILEAVKEVDKNIPQLVGKRIHEILGDPE